MDVTVAFSGFVTVFFYGTKKMLFNRRWIIALLITVLVAAVMGYAGSQAGIDRLSGGVGLMDSLILFFFMPVMAMIYGASVIRDEIEDKSITQIITAPQDRSISYLGYYVALASSLSLIMMVISTVGWLAFFGQKGIDGEAANLLAAMLGLMVLGSFVYSSFFLMISVLLNRPMFLGLFYAFIWEGFIGSIPGVASMLSIKYYIRVVGSQWINHGSIGGFATEYGNAPATLVVLPVVMLALGIFIFREKEFP